MVEILVENVGIFLVGIGEFGENTPLNAPKNPGFLSKGLCRTCPTRRKLLANEKAEKWLKNQTQMKKNSY